MTHLIDTQADLDAALAGLIAADVRLAALVTAAGRPTVRRRPGGFAGLASIVVAQQLSTASAAAIWKRLTEAFDPLDANAVVRARTAKLQRAGLSMPKIRTLKAAAKAIKSGRLDLDSLAQLPAEEAHRTLIEVHGVGPWTADIYLLFCLGHADAWPAGDLALQEAMRLAFALDVRPSAKETLPLAEPWRPWRGAAACLLWAYYRSIKRSDGVTVLADRNGA